MRLVGSDHTCNLAKLLPPGQDGRKEPLTPSPSLSPLDLTPPSQNNIYPLSPSFSLPIHHRYLITSPPAGGHPLPPLPSNRKLALAFPSNTKLSSDTCDGSRTSFGIFVARGLVRRKVRFCVCSTPNPCLDWLISNISSSRKEQQRHRVRTKEKREDRLDAYPYPTKQPVIERRCRRLRRAGILRGRGSPQRRHSGNPKEVETETFGDGCHSGATTEAKSSPGTRRSHLGG